jgi:hypothetical protein
MHRGLSRRPVRGLRKEEPCSSQAVVFNCCIHILEPLFVAIRWCYRHSTTTQNLSPRQHSTAHNGVCIASHATPLLKRRAMSVPFTASLPQRHSTPTVTTSQTDADLSLRNAPCTSAERLWRHKPTTDTTPAPTTAPTLLHTLSTPPAAHSQMLRLLLQICAELTVTSSRLLHAQQHTQVLHCYGTEPCRCKAVLCCSLCRHAVHNVSKQQVKQAVLLQGAHMTPSRYKPKPLTRHRVLDIQRQTPVHTP